MQSTARTVPAAPGTGPAILQQRRNARDSGQMLDTQTGGWSWLAKKEAESPAAANVPIQPGHKGEHLPEMITRDMLRHSPLPGAAITTSGQGGWGPRAVKDMPRP